MNRESRYYYLGNWKKEIDNKMRPIRNSAKNCWRKFEYKSSEPNSFGERSITWEDESQQGAFKYQLESLVDQLQSGQVRVKNNEKTSSVENYT